MPPLLLRRTHDENVIAQDQENVAIIQGHDQAGQVSLSKQGLGHANKIKRGRIVMQLGMVMMMIMLLNGCWGFRRGGLRHSRLTVPIVFNRDQYQTLGRSTRRVPGCAAHTVLLQGPPRIQGTCTADTVCSICGSVT